MLTPREVELVKNILHTIQSETDDVDSWGRVKVPFNFSPLERHDINNLCAKLNKPSEPEVKTRYFNFTNLTGEELRARLKLAKNSEVLSK